MVRPWKLIGKIQDNNFQLLLDVAIRLLYIRAILGLLYIRVLQWNRFTEESIEKEFTENTSQNLMKIIDTVRTISCLYKPVGPTELGLFMIRPC